MSGFEAIIAAGLGAAISGGASVASQQLAQAGADERAFAANAKGAEMAFDAWERSRDEAARVREWTERQNEIVRWYNRAEASEARDFSARAADIQFQRQQYQYDREQAFAREQTQVGQQFAQSQQQREFEMEQALAGAQREWQERMSGTAYQRQVNDLRAAGLNPMLGFMGGGGASTPSGGVGNVSAPTAPLAAAHGASPGLPSSAVASAAAGHGATAQSFQATPVRAETIPMEFGNLVSSAVGLGNLVTATQRAAAEIDNLKAETLNKALYGKQISAQTSFTEAQTIRELKAAGLTDAQIQTEVARMRSYEADPAVKAAQAQAALAAAQHSTAAVSTAQAQAALYRRQEDILRTTGGGHVSRNFYPFVDLGESVRPGGYDVVSGTQRELDSIGRAILPLLNFFSGGAFPSLAPGSAPLTGRGGRPAGVTSNPMGN